VTSLAELKRALSQFTPSGSPFATWFLPELRGLLNAQFAGAYSPAAREDGWALEFMHGTGEGSENYVRRFREYVAGLPASETFLALSNPHLVQVEQRNRVFSLSDIVTAKVLGDRDEVFHSLFRNLGILGHDQLRVLICDGPGQLAWVGATREEPFTEREKTILRTLRRPLRERLRLERRLASPTLLSATLDAALEHLPSPAFLIGPGFRVELANRAGHSALERDRKSVLAAIRESVYAPDASTYSITEVVATGSSSYLLAVQRERNHVAELVLVAKVRWGLTARQARVLELVATGASNKEIAAVLGSSEATIENHLTELFRRSGARSRAGLVGLLIT